MLRWKPAAGGEQGFPSCCWAQKVSRTSLSDGSVRVEFDLDPNFRVEAVDGSVELSCAEPFAFVIRPHQRQARPEWWDLFEWRVHAPSGNSVLLGVDLGRAVWALGEGEQPPVGDEWGVEVLQLQRSDFAATSKKVVWIWVPWSLRGNKVAVCIAQCNRNNQGMALPERMVVKDGHFYRLPLRELEHLIPEQTGEYAVILQHAKGTLEIGRFDLRYQCRLCGFRAREQKAILHHAAVRHLSECFNEISAIEIWEREGKLLPDRVYVCGYCGKGFPEYGAENGNTAVSAHQLYECPRARQGTNVEPVTVKIRVLERGQDDEGMIKALVGDKGVVGIVHSRLISKTPRVIYAIMLLNSSSFAERRCEELCIRALSGIWPIDYVISINPFWRQRFRSEIRSFVARLPTRCGASSWFVNRMSSCHRVITGAIRHVLSLESYWAKMSCPLF